MKASQKYQYPVDDLCVCHAPMGVTGHTEQSNRIFDSVADLSISLPHPCTKHLKCYQNAMWMEVTDDLRRCDEQSATESEVL
jgi:hypothetical protein